MSRGIEAYMRYLEIVTILIFDLKSNFLGDGVRIFILVRLKKLKKS